MPAKVPNPRKQFQFGIFLPGLNPFLAQDVKLPDIDFDIQEHGDTNFQVKTAGQVKYSNLQISKIMPATGLDNYMDQWAQRIQNTLLGGGELPSQYKVEAIVEEYSNDGITVLHRHTLSGVWPCKLNGKDLSRKGSENTIHSLEFCVDEMRS